jgi:hypothetical protein
MQILIESVDDMGFHCNANQEDRRPMGCVSDGCSASECATDVCRSQQVCSEEHLSGQGYNGVRCFTDRFEMLGIRRLLPTPRSCIFLA